MKLLLVAATETEIMPLLQHLKQCWTTVSPHVYKQGEVEVHICVTGIGIAATAYTVTKALCAQRYDMALQIGIGGSFDRSLNLGSLVLVQSEQFGDLGAEDHDNYLTLFDMGLLPKDQPPFSNEQLVNPLHYNRITLPQVSGLTVHTVSGNAHTIVRRTAMYASCVVESMEGAAFHYVCLQEGMPFAQVRSISNYVEPRNRSAWKIKEAVIALNEWVVAFLKQQ